MGTDHIDLNRPKNKERLDTYGKCIIRTYYLKNFENHHKGNTYKCDKIVLPDDATEEKLAESPIHLNHYVIQSWNWFKNVKMTRGDSAGQDAENSRNKSYFDYYNFHDIEDTELSNIYAKRLKETLFI